MVSASRGALLASLFSFLACGEHPIEVWPNPLIKYDASMLSSSEIRFLLDFKPPMTASPHTDMIYTGENRDLQRDAGPHRTSTASGFYVQMEDLLPTLRGVIRKLSAFGGHPPSHGEPLQIQRYVEGGKYSCHYDPSWNNDLDRPHSATELTSIDPIEGAAAGRRMVTVITYLADTCLGGDTVFPLVNSTLTSIVGIEEACEGTEEGVRFLPRAGASVYFSHWDEEDGSVFRPESWHCSCPIGGGGGHQRNVYGSPSCSSAFSAADGARGQEGAGTGAEKWIVQYWIHEGNLHWHRGAVATYPFMQRRGVEERFPGFSYQGVAEVEELRSTQAVNFDVPVGEGVLRFEGEGGGVVHLPTLPDNVDIRGFIRVKDGKWSSGRTLALALKFGSLPSYLGSGSLSLSFPGASLSLDSSRPWFAKAVRGGEFLYVFASFAEDGERVHVTVHRAGVLYSVCSGNAGCRDEVGLTLVENGGEVGVRNEGLEGVTLGGLRVYDEFISKEDCVKGYFFGWF